MKIKKAQISIEYFMIFTILLVFLILIVFYFISAVPEEIKIRQATDSVNKIARTIDTVYAIGPGARRVIYVSIPSGTEYINLTPFPNKIGGEIALGLTYEGRLINIIATTNANITGEIHPGKTQYKLYIQTKEDRVVRISTNLTDEDNNA